MSLWARAKHTVQLDWRAEWREIEAGTRGEEPGTMIELVDQMNESGTVERAAVALGIGYHHVVRKAQSLGIRRHPGTFYATEDAS